MKLRLPFRITEERLVLLFAGFAVVGLLIAGHSLFTARGTTTLIVPPEAAATVNGVRVLRTDFETGLRAQYDVDVSAATKEQKDDILNALIREELYVQRARELDVANFDSDVRALYQRATQNFIAAKAMTHPASESAVRAFYETNRARFYTEGEMDVVDFTLPVAAAGRAQDLAAAIKAGHGAPEAAAHFAGAKADASDKSFYFAAHARLGDRLFEAARKMAVGSVSAPITLGDGVHLLYVAANDPPRLLPYEEVRLKARDEYVLDQARKEQAALRRGAEIRIAEDLK